MFSGPAVRKIVGMPFDLGDLHALHTGDRDRGWAFIRALTAADDRPLADAAVLRSAEDRLGVPLPAALREAYLLFGRRADLTATQDWLMSPRELRLGDGVLTFRMENQSCASWGVPANALDRDDPPVVLNSGNGWTPYANRLSQALVEMVLSEAMFSADESHVDNRELDEHAEAELNAAYAPLPLPVFPLWARADGPGIRWLTGPDVLLRDDGGLWLWVYGRTPDAVQAVRAHLPGDWLMIPEPDG